MIFERLGAFVVRRYKLVIVIWIVVLLLSVPLIMRVGDVISYQQESSGEEGTTESEVAQRILDEQFPTSISNSTMLIVIEADDVSGPDMRDFLLDFERRVAGEEGVKYVETPEPGGLPKGFISVYTVERFALTLAVVEGGNGIAAGIQQGMGMAIAGAEQSISENATGMAQVIYGVPAAHLGAWTGAAAEYGPALDPTNMTMVGGLDGQAYLGAQGALAVSLGGMDPAMAGMAMLYLDAYSAAWNSSSTNVTLVSDPQARAEAAIGQAAPAFIAGLPLDEEAVGMMMGVYSAFNLSTFSDDDAIADYAAASAEAMAPMFEGDVVNATIEMTAELGGMDETFVRSIYDLGGPFDYNYSSPDAMPSIAGHVEGILENGTLDTYPVRLPEERLAQFIGPDNDVTIVMVGFSKGDEYVDEDGTRPIMDNVGEVRDILDDLKGDHEVAGIKTYVSGGAALSSDIEETTLGDMQIIEFVTIPLLIVLMGLFFRSVLTPFVPLGAVMIALGLSQAAVFIIGTMVADIDSMVTTMLFTILMGVGTDYSIFIVARYREERVRGASRDEAVKTSVTWAGESIATSGATVMIAFFSLGIASYSMVKIMGLVMGVAILIALLISLTLVPALLMLIGNRVFWPNNKQRFKRYSSRIMERKNRGQHGYFYKAAKFSVTHAKAVVLVAILVTVPTAYLFLTTETSYDFIGAMPAVESTDGMDAMADGFGAGRIFPSDVVLVFDSRVLLPDGNFSVANLDIVDKVCQDLARLDIVHDISGPTMPYGKSIPYATPEEVASGDLDKMREYIGIDNMTVHLSFVLTEEPTSEAAIDAVPELRSTVNGALEDAGASGSVEAYVGGSTAGMADVADTMNTEFAQMELLVIFGIFVVLLIVLGSLFLPAFAIITIGMSIMWSFAATYLIFDVWLGVPILFIVPLILFIMLMGLGMDYNIFILTRIREEVHKGKSDEDAIVDAVDWTGGIITALAIIMGGAIGAMMLSSTMMLAEFGFCIAFAILMDAMVVRTYIVPATMKLLGKWNWYAPGLLQRERRETRGKGKAEVKGKGRARESPPAPKEAPKAAAGRSPKPKKTKGKNVKAPAGVRGKKGTA